MYLDSLALLHSQVGYGSLGLHGNLGYEGKAVTVKGKHYGHALSTHPPAQLRFHLQQRFASFTCQVALNDDIPAGASHADFIVLADGREVTVEPYVRAGEPPRTLMADVAGAEHLDLLVRTSRWEYSHAVWLDPQVDETPAPVAQLVDCLGRAALTVPHQASPVERCIATVVSPGFESLLDDMLGSLVANGGCQDALLVVFVLNSNGVCERVAAKYGAMVVRGRSLARLSPASKALLYSVARVVTANCYLCLDADMLVLGSLRPVFAALEACPDGKIFACREGNSQENSNLGHALRAFYGGGDADVRQLDMTPQDEAYPLVVNDGLFAGGRAALLALDGSIRAMPQATAWADGHRRVSWRNQFVFNLALARLQCGVELDPIYNVQLHVQNVELQEQGSRVRATFRTRPARVLHFSGGAKRKYPSWQGKYAGVSDPLVGAGSGDSYADFLEALRVWVGNHGLKGLAWSFYGLSDGNGATVRDPSVLPLLATLHYLIRANGCVRVIETGTARGISTACLASAVARRTGARVVTMDPFLHPGREELWSTLPTYMHACIEPRCVDALVGMQAALTAGESYHAALLDSIHSEEHVWAEFQLATQLICPGGLILIHDAIYAHGTVSGALRRIEAAGYNVVRLWTAEEGVAEDDQLGLAVIENRRRQPAVANGHDAQPAVAPVHDSTAVHP